MMKKYPRFLYKGYNVKFKKNNLEIVFNFEIPPDISFSPKIRIKNIERKKIRNIDKEVLDNLIFHLGLAEIPSYWKTTCSPIIEIKAGFLNSEQIKWWKDLIIKGMGQYFFENKIDFKKPDFLKITQNPAKTASAKKIKLKKGKKSPLNRFLVPMGEGKDSTVTLQLLKKRKINLNCFLVNPNKIHFKILKKAGIKNPVIIEREIDQKLFELNRKGFLNGHVPITALYSFLAVFSAVLFGYDNVVFSNERSSNEGNLKYLGETINHQYSKSFDFEQRFRDYLKKYLISNVNYFSFLRPFYEIQIAKIFSNFPQYFPLFLSCNVTKKTFSGRNGFGKLTTEKPTFKWCGKCPKCLFVFIILYSFLTEKQLIKIFGQNLLNQKRFLLLMLKLTGEKSFKPFECVGTKKETLSALYLSWQKSKRAGDTPELLKYFKKKVFPKYPNLKKISKNIMTSWNKQNNLPKNLDIFLKNY